MKVYNGILVYDNEDDVVRLLITTKLMQHGQAIIYNDNLHKTMKHTYTVANPEGPFIAMDITYGLPIAKDTKLVLVNGDVKTVVDISDEKNDMLIQMIYDMTYKDDNEKENYR